MLRCLTVEQIEQLLTGPADRLFSELMESHLSACPHCQKTFVRATDIRDAALWRAASAASDEICTEDKSFLEGLKALSPQSLEVEQARPGRAVDANHLIALESNHGHAPQDVVQRNTACALLPHVPGFEILGELGRGGMGIVFKALQTAHDRIVALKMIQPGREASPEDLGRFHDEAAAIARLRHPHIVQIYGSGQVDGRLYFVLEYVEGGTLADQIRDKPLHPRSAAQLMESLARAMHFAHQQRIIHRDLKPVNVLLQSRKSFLEIPAEPGHRPTDWDFRGLMPKITDFGLAKLLDRVGQGHTASGDVVGTPSYMAPEQAQGKPYPVGATTDVYALGAILYEVLTGRPPFLGPTPLETLNLVYTEEPIPPRKLVRDIPLSLETICLKCLRKDPAQRYQTAEELAEDLRLCVDGQPIRARAEHPIQSVWRSLRRKTGTMFFAMLALLTAGVAGGAMVYLVRLGERSAIQTEVKTIEARSARRNAVAAQLRFALAECERGHVEQGTAALADLLADVEPLPDLKDYRDTIRTNLALWSRTLPALKFALPAAASAAALSADGNFVITADDNKRVFRWTLPEGRCDDETWNAPDAVDALSISADGQRVAVRLGNRLHRGDWLTDDSAKLAPEKGDLIGPATLSPNGKRLFAVREDKPLVIEGSATVPMLLNLTPTHAAWNPTSDALLLGAADGRAIIVLRTEHGWKEGPTFKHRSPIAALSWANGGTVVAAACTDGQTALWDAAHGGFIAAFPAHPAGPVLLAGGNRRFVLTAGADRLAKIWQADSGTLVTALPHPEGVKTIAMAESGAFLTLDQAGTVRIWDPPDIVDQLTFGGDQEPLTRPIPSADGKTIFAIIGDDSSRAVRWTLPKGESLLFAFKELAQFESIRVLAVGSAGKAVVVTQTKKRKETWLVSIAGKRAEAVQSLPHSSEVKAALFRVDGPEFLTWDAAGNAHLWNADSGHPVGKPISFPGIPAAFAISPDGKTMILGGRGTDKPGLAKVVSLEENDQPGLLLHHAEPVVEVWFESSGTAVRTRDARHSVFRWEILSANPLETSPLPENSRLVALSPSGDRHVVFGSDGVLRLFVGGDRALVALTVPATTKWRSARFSDDGQTLLTSWTDGIRLWDARTAQPLGPTLVFPNADDGTIVGMNGGHMLAWHGTEARLWRLPNPSFESAESWRLWLSVRTGLIHDANGTARSLDARTWKQNRNECEARKLSLGTSP